MEEKAQEEVLRLCQEAPESQDQRVQIMLDPLPQSRKQEVLRELDQASSPGFDYFVLDTLSCIIATLGLITNSVAVIIGAMLVAPLMSPSLVFHWHRWRVSKASSAKPSLLWARERCWQLRYLRW